MDACFAKKMLEIHTTKTAETIGKPLLGLSDYRNSAGSCQNRLKLDTLFTFPINSLITSITEKQGASMLQNTSYESEWDVPDFGVLTTNVADHLSFVVYGIEYIYIYPCKRVISEV